MKAKSVEDALHYINDHGKIAERFVIEGNLKAAIKIRDELRRIFEGLITQGLSSSDYYLLHAWLDKNLAWHQNVLLTTTDRRVIKAIKAGERWVHKMHRKLLEAKP